MLLLLLLLLVLLIVVMALLNMVFTNRNDVGGRLKVVKTAKARRAMDLLHRRVTWFHAIPRQHFLGHRFSHLGI